MSTSEKNIREDREEDRLEEKDRREEEEQRKVPEE